ncbi:hypothetical protein [Microbacterium sp. NPDC057658]|uniref:hypothetical protein n=1 Tax=unclassified Microbacterium TaxID=2609290 RepID=UPI00366AFD3E
MPENSIDPAMLRKFDQNLHSSGGLRAARVIEPVPFCWFCDARAGRRTKEHIFPQWLLRHHGAMDERVQPHRISVLLGGAKLSERGERPLRAHVNGEVCATCNNGWMSALERAVTPVLTAPAPTGTITATEAETLARWFAKTAVNLNVSQPFRLLVDAESRHGLATEIPERFAVPLFRVRTQDGVFDWLQKSPEIATSGELGAEDVLRATELTLVTHIRVADLVGVVVHVPQGLRPTDVKIDTALQIYPAPRDTIAWEQVPIADDYLGPLAILDVVGT